MSSMIRLTISALLFSLTVLPVYAAETQPTQLPASSLSEATTTPGPTSPLLEPAIAPSTPGIADPTINERIDSLVDWMGDGLSMHKENYLLFPTWSGRATTSADSELKLQLSLKQQILNSRFYVGYTQKSFWRILDQADSRPFRETNHNPEIFFRYVAPPEKAGRFSAWGADFGAEHESNGAREPISRSWNRLYITPFVTWGNLRADLKIWHRLSEEVKSDPLDPTGDENPNIEDYLGNGELRLTYLFKNRYLKGSLASIRTRWSFEEERGALQLDLSRPTKSKHVFVFAHLFTGYGESLIDYDRSVTRYGVGVMFKR